MLRCHVLQLLGILLLLLPLLLLPPPRLRSEASDCRAEAVRWNAGAPLVARHSVLLRHVLLRWCTGHARAVSVSDRLLGAVHCIVVDGCGPPSLLIRGHS